MRSWRWLIFGCFRWDLEGGHALRLTDAELKSGDSFRVPDQVILNKERRKIKACSVGKQRKIYENEREGQKLILASTAQINGEDLEHDEYKKLASSSGIS